MPWALTDMPKLDSQMLHMVTTLEADVHLNHWQCLQKINENMSRQKCYYMIYIYIFFLNWNCHLAQTGWMISAELKSLNYWSKAWHKLTLSWNQAPRWRFLKAVYSCKINSEYRWATTSQPPVISFSFALHISSADLTNFLVNSSTWEKEGSDNTQNIVKLIHCFGCN